MSKSNFREDFMKLSEVQVGDKLHIVDDLFGSHKKVEVVEEEEQKK